MSTYYITKPINIPLGQDVNDVREKLCRKLALKDKELVSFRLHRQSLDARDKSDVHYVCSYVIQATRAPRQAVVYQQPIDVLQQAKPRMDAPSCIVVGAGPAGLFCALYLAKSGAKVTVVERGSDVPLRSKKVQRFFRGGDLDERCNVQFGLGGAGTFSDGKLTTGISSPLTYTVFSQLVRSGAPADILTSSLPHVGTDKLVDVVARLRDEIVSYGGRFVFDALVTDFIVNDNVVTGVEIDSCQKLFADCVVLACGHSARDVFARLYDLGADILFKPFAVGLRIEHSRQFVDSAQYGSVLCTHRDLPSASYKLVHNGKQHSCYTFCMCPGGEVVCATSENGGVVVNGMSNYRREGEYSNSALVVNVTAQDVLSYGFGDDPFAGVRFQRHLERKAFELGGGNYVAPCQNVTDFRLGRNSERLEFVPTYQRGAKIADLHALLPKPVCDALCEALDNFDGKIKGFGTSGVLVGVESRTSSPVRIVRDEDMQSNLRHLYPTGEGAGYAGGIVSSAVDGLKVAMKILS